MTETKTTTNDDQGRGTARDCALTEVAVLGLLDLIADYAMRGEDIRELVSDEMAQAETPDELTPDEAASLSFDGIDVDQDNHGIAFTLRGQRYWLHIEPMEQAEERAMATYDGPEPVTDNQTEQRAKERDELIEQAAARIAAGLREDYPDDDDAEAYFEDTIHEMRDDPIGEMAYEAATLAVMAGMRLPVSVNEPVTEDVKAIPTSQLWRACAYLNEDRAFHDADVAAWSIDPGKLALALGLDVAGGPLTEEEMNEVDPNQDALNGRR
jgi:hypothetical protein